ncbi:Uncharacterised protein [Mycobacterium tuberculosis]|uniref:Uncharacterized protein n=1 Tax=Mycobacterium tuberculosis TaxID=1773 RepID=A0A654TY33_MYCTX|nr:Uncharacterised protein [Mycobacterium tuberculosis]CKQ69878.1 Uncharacterised protein [Mycobacterium tuberculosis]CKT97778.1 Uncharacterised protein [Mycobacterium tuberculosis]CNW16467.1 Uncharacterised protein [Mycobacterium tuberculosis]COZ52246.1 Uncharacterised protein [Mycobacterium tuberculosis]
MQEAADDLHVGGAEVAGALGGGGGGQQRGQGLAG